MSMRTVVRNVRDLLEAVDGVDPDALIVWEYTTGQTSGQREATVDAYPTTVYVTLHLPDGSPWGEW